MVINRPLMVITLHILFPNPIKCVHPPCLSLSLSIRLSPPTFHISFPHYHEKENRAKKEWKNSSFSKTINTPNSHSHPHTFYFLILSLTSNQTNWNHEKKGSGPKEFRKRTKQEEQGPPRGRRARISYFSHAFTSTLITEEDYPRKKLTENQGFCTKQHHRTSKFGIPGIQKQVQQDSLSLWSEQIQLLCLIWVSQWSYRKTSFVCNLPCQPRHSH